MPAPKDLAGQSFGRLTVRRLAGPGEKPPGSGRLWIVDCSCGTTGLLMSARELAGGRTSCGCKVRERSLEGVACTLCGARAVSGRSGLCHNHQEQWRRWGKPDLAGWIAAYREGRLLTCEICERPFNGYPNRKTCGDECEAEYRRRAALGRYHSLPAERREVYYRAAKDRSRAERGRRKVKLVCQLPGCGAEFVGFPYQKFHSAACRDAYRFRYARRSRGRKLAVNTAAALGKLADVAANPSERPPKQCRLCEARAVARGLCRSHWDRWRREGKPDVEDFVRDHDKGGASVSAGAGGPGGPGPRAGRADDRPAQGGTVPVA